MTSHVLTCIMRMPPHQPRYRAWTRARATATQSLWTRPWLPPRRARRLAPPSPSICSCSLSLSLSVPLSLACACTGSPRSRIASLDACLAVPKLLHCVGVCDAGFGQALVRLWSGFGVCHIACLAVPKLLHCFALCCACVTSAERHTSAERDTQVPRDAVLTEMHPICAHVLTWREGERSDEAPNRERGRSVTASDRHTLLALLLVAHTHRVCTPNAGHTRCVHAKRLLAVWQGLEAKEPYKMLAKLAPPIPSAPPPPQEGEE
jgi:hypothetical protein